MQLLFDQHITSNLCIYSSSSMVLSIKDKLLSSLWLIRPCHIRLRSLKLSSQNPQQLCHCFILCLRVGTCWNFLIIIIIIIIMELPVLWWSFDFLLQVCVEVWHKCPLKGSLERFPVSASGVAICYRFFVKFYYIKLVASVIWTALIITHPPIFNIRSY